MRSSAALLFLLHTSIITATVPVFKGYTRQWADDFTGTLGKLPSSTNWNIDTGTSYPGGPSQWGTGEIETYSQSTTNLYLDGTGNLKIKPVYSSKTKAWTSARIETVKTNFKPTAGKIMRIQASISLPNVTAQNGLGYWPAFWILGHAFRGNYTNWPSVGEIDIMENVNGGNQIYETLHCGTDPYGPCNEPNGLGSAYTCTGKGCVGGFHNYTLEIDRTKKVEELRWYVDGQLGKTLDSSQLGAATWSATVDQGFFIILNVAMGGALPNAIYGGYTPTAQTVSGMPMIVDYVAVWEST